MLTFQPQCDTLVIREPGNYHWRQGGEKHLNDPVSIGVLQVYYSIHFYV
jgi:glutamate synthase (NADPH/NADH)